MKEKTIRTYVNENGILCRETQKDMKVSVEDKG